MLRIIPPCIRSYLKSVLIYKFLILDTYHLETVYLGEQVWEEPWLFFEVKMDPRAKAFGKHCHNSAALEISGSFKDFKRISIILLRQTVSIPQTALSAR